MVIVRVIDLVVLFLRILGGRVDVPGVVRGLAWIAAASLILAGIGLVAFFIASLPDIVNAVAGL